MGVASLSTLPQETVLEILDFMPIKDVVSLRDALSNSSLAQEHLRRCIKTRLSPVNYLEQGPFYIATQLLDVMSQHDAVVSGSKALAFLVPGSDSPESDWDIYVPPNRTAVVAVKITLEASGVRFETSLTAAGKLLRDNLTVTLDKRQITSIILEHNLGSRQGHRPRPE